MSFTKDRSIRVFAGFTSYRSDLKLFGSTSATTLLTRTRTGESNPHWRQQVRDQQDATTSMSGTFDTKSTQLGVAKVYYKNPNDFSDQRVYYSVTVGDFFFGHKPYTSYAMSENVANNRALIAYLKHVRAAQVSFSAPTFLGELGEAIHMIRHPAQNLRNLAGNWIKRCKNLKNHSPLGWKKELGGAWLEQAFGWQPLVNDINSAFKTWKGLRDSKDQVPVSGFGIEESRIAGQCFSNQTLSIPYGISYIYSQSTREQVFVKYKGMVTRRVTGSEVNKLEPFGFTFDEFIPTAWELLPWSFLIDYFSNIGDVITAGVAARNSIAWTNKSVVKKLISQQVGGFDLPGTKLSWNRFISGGGEPVVSKCERRQVVRTPGAAVGQPTLSFEIPSLPAQWANMTALFAQASADVHPQRLRRRHH